MVQEATLGLFAGFLPLVLFGSEISVTPPVRRT
jgi:hypothetical protein